MNTSTIKQRLRQLAKYQEVSIYQFEKSIGASNGYISSIKDEISTKYVRNILRAYPNISLEWLVTGEGSMLKSGAVNSTQITQTANGNNNSQTQHVNSTLAGEVQELTRQIQELQQQNAKLIDIISQLTK
ncbi:hypothetical protein [Porphyromonas somerae]|uniref:hypothetical protein n=1 Tax=Porphyromonas somerae TaxID=322095 RepID=UPI001FCBFC44|nr:hypothetical protein [Porphyromonas somerae]BDE81808.1 hypothetical protein CE91St14_08360 [Porphyromonas somerae]